MTADPKGPAVSVLLAARDHERWAGEAVESVLAQEEVDLELIVIDDGSRDGTAAAIRAAAGTDPRVIFRAHDVSRGLAATLNEGLRIARGRFIAFLGSDDRWYPGHLAAACRRLEGTGAALAYADVDLVDGDGAPHPEAERIRRVLAWDRPGAEGNAWRELLDRNFVPFISAVVRREVMGRFDARLEVLLDWAQWLRIAARHRIVRVEGVAGAFRWHGGNASHPDVFGGLGREAERAIVLGAQYLAAERVSRRAVAGRYRRALARIGRGISGRPGRRLLRVALGLAPTRIDLLFRIFVPGRGPADRPQGALRWLPLRPRLTVATITHDRDTELAGLLASVRGHADEVVVVDGAGLAGTRRLVEAEAGGVWVHRPWDDCYAAARNEALERATGEWVLFLDTDERLGERFARALPRLIGSLRWDAYRIPMYWHVSLSPPRYLVTRKHDPCRVPRLFRRTAVLGLPDAPRVHESVPRSRRGRTRDLPRRLRLHHLVLALLDEAALAAKRRRYEAIDPSSRATNERYYLWRDRPHRVRVCPESYTGAP